MIGIGSFLNLGFVENVSVSCSRLFYRVSNRISADVARSKWFETDIFLRRQCDKKLDAEVSIVYETRYAAGRSALLWSVMLSKQIDQSLSGKCLDNSRVRVRNLCSVEPNREVFLKCLPKAINHSIRSSSVSIAHVDLVSHDPCLFELLNKSSQ